MHVLDCLAWEFLVGFAVPFPSGFWVIGFLQPAQATPSYVSTARCAFC